MTGNLDTTVTEGATQTSATGPQSACDEEDGTFEVTCSGTTPFCVSGECVSCSTDEPLRTCPDAMVCDRNGACVVCTSEDATACSGGTPVCDPDTNACVPCTEHAQCGMAACNLFTGECVQGMVVDVVPGAGALAAAVAAVGNSGTIVVANGTYDEPVTVGRGATVAFLAAPTAAPQWWRSTGVGAPQLRVTGGATVFVDGIDFRLNDGNVDPAIRIDAAGTRFWVDRATIAQNFGVGVRVEGAQLMMRNGFVGGANNLAALDVVGGMAEVLYSTLAAAFGSSNALSCDATAMVAVSDSILIAQDSTGEVACDAIMAEHTATNETVLAGTGNVPVGQTDEGWFVDYSAGDFHLVGDGPATFMEIAQWDIGDPTVDIDGEPRGGVDGQADYAGADVP